MQWNFSSFIIKVMTIKRIIRTTIILVTITISFLIPKQILAEEPDAVKLIGYVNAYRETNGVGKLNMNPILMSSAQAHADYLARTYNVEKGGDGTIGEGSTLPSDRAYQYGYAPWGRYDVVECWIVLFKDFPLDRVVTNDWWRTPENQKNLLDGWGTSHTDIGVGIAYNGNLTYYVVDIGVSLVDPNAVYATNEAGVEYSYVPVETATPLPDGSIIHTVKTGENLQLIALSYGVSISSIMEYSGLTGSSILYPEQQLVIQKAYDDSSPGLARTIAIGIPTETATFAPTFTARPPATVTPEPTTAPPTPTLTTTPDLKGANQVSFGLIGLLAIILGIIVLVVFFIMYSRRH